MEAASAGTLTGGGHTQFLSLHVSISTCLCLYPSLSTCLCLYMSVSLHDICQTSIAGRRLSVDGLPDDFAIVPRIVSATLHRIRMVWSGSDGSGQYLAQMRLTPLDRVFKSLPVYVSIFNVSFRLSLPVMSSAVHLTVCLSVPRQRRPPSTLMDLDSHWSRSLCGRPPPLSSCCLKPCRRADYCSTWPPTTPYDTHTHNYC